MTISVSPSYSDEKYINYAEPNDYWQLLKPRVMSLVVFTAFVGIMITPSTMPLFLKLISLIAISVGAGASGALNMWYDADIDKIMIRTSKRPIPSGAILQETARDFGLVLSLLSVITLALSSNYLAASLLAFTIFFYVVIYTMWLKRLTPQNIVIGGLSGALPPVIGAAAVSGELTLSSIMLCGIVFLWTPPHFWALALVKKQDYQAVNIPMYPNIKGDKRTIIEIITYSIILFFATLMPIYFGKFDILYSVFAVCFGLYYIYTCIMIALSQGKNDFHKKCMKSFFCSIIYLFGLFLTPLVEVIFQVNLI